jgi:hypothetical protein
MNASGLYRSKFDERRGPVTYLQQTIGYVFDRLETTYTPPSDPRMTVGKAKEVTGLSGWADLDEIAGSGIEPTPQLVSGEVYAGRVHLVHSKPG